MIMKGINLEKPIKYNSASFRYFKMKEHHITRLCHDNVLLLVFKGVLRFNENGVDYEIAPGQYHIQKQNSLQAGPQASDAPEYLYVHFFGEECDNEKGVLGFWGDFDIEKLMPLMIKLDELAHSQSTYISQSAVFYEILSILSKQKTKKNTANKIAAYIDKNYNKNITLEDIKKEFLFTKNHIINLFKREYNITPFEYLKKVRLNNALRKIEATSDSLEEIAYSCGFNDYPYFYKVFKKELKISPEKWRKQKWGKE